MSLEKGTTLDEILSCRGKTRILMLLSEAKELNITEIAKNVGLNHSTINNHLIQLEKSGLITESESISTVKKTQEHKQ
jgi:predicted transcriptional regulator